MRTRIQKREGDGFLASAAGVVRVVQVPRAGTVTGVDAGTRNVSSLWSGSRMK